LEKRKLKGARGTEGRHGRSKLSKRIVTERMGKPGSQDSIHGELVHTPHRSESFKQRKKKEKRGGVGTGGDERRIRHSRDWERKFWGEVRMQRNAEGRGLARDVQGRGKKLHSMRRKMGYPK